MTRNRKTFDLYCVKKRKLQNKKLWERSIDSKTHQTNLVPRVLWVISKLGNYPQDPGNEVAIKPEQWVGKRERFPANFAIMSQSESYFASLGVVKWLPCELLREKWRQTAKRGVTTTRHERELIFLSLFIFYFK